MTSLSANRFVAAGMALALSTGSASAMAVGKPAPKFSFTTFDGKSVASDDLKGKVVVLNYWATWCAPCRAELLAFYKYAKAHPNADLQIVEVSTENYVPNGVYKSLAAAVPFPFARKLSSWGYGTMEGAVPTNYVIDRTGVLRYAKAGAFDEASLDEVVGPLLAEDNPAQQASASSPPPSR